MKQLIVAALLLSASVVSQAKELAQYDNANGGQTILTNVACPVNDEYLYGLATGKDKPTQTFCWTTEKDDVILYLPLNKQVKIKITEFEKRNAKKDTKPLYAL